MAPSQGKGRLLSVFNENFTNYCGLQYARPVRPGVPVPNNYQQQRKLRSERSVRTSVKKEGRFMPFIAWVHEHSGLSRACVCADSRAANLRLPALPSVVLARPVSLISNTRRGVQPLTDPSPRPRHGFSLLFPSMLHSHKAAASCGYFILCICLFLDGSLS